ncbi:TlpA disulfide reductase family protein [Pedobacter africanus]|uniref:Peroxiredoxin n=1 Tax=Pedobacter africanus TaxID=151894 RepID=A0A1W2A3P4_9SPHI|nr:TlpA disulfide reductase family protein [Pedobacter africanus]SMC55280.1 Peroxiredoxin [Pedobacter africanus]
MKKYLLTCLLFTGILPVMAQQGTFVLQGKIKGMQTGKLKLAYESGGKYQMDSTLVKNGTFVFKGTALEPVMASIESEKAGRMMDDPNRGMLFLESGKLSLELTAGDFRNLKLKGSKTHDEYAALELRQKPVMDQMRKLSAEYDKANIAYSTAKKAGKPEAEQEALKEAANTAKDKMDPFREQLGEIDMEFIKSHPDSYYTASMLRWRASSMSLDESKAIYAGLSERIKQSKYGQEFAKEIKNLEGGSPGAKANLFSATDINGQSLNLADYKGKKYLLLDFWASWCVPCRKGNPHLLSLYSKYKDKGLEIVGVSDDDGNPEAWKKAVEKDGIGVWKHVLRGLKQVGNSFDRSADLSDSYAIHTLPTKILIDKEGTIIGRYGGGGENDEAMDKKLAEIFNQ